MNRGQQREISLILMASLSPEPTLAVTAHCNEVLMEHLQSAGIELRGDYSAELRRRMALSGHAMPNGSFPIETCGDLAAARGAISRAEPSQWRAIEAYIARRALALGC